MTATPVEVPESTFAALRLRYDDAQIVELTSAIAWENYRARFDHALGVEAEGYSKGAYCPLPKPRKNEPG
jgi:alkylhydroperoxidase family enzyme